jgi:hypothetical protein
MKGSAFFKLDITDGAEKDANYLAARLEAVMFQMCDVDPSTKDTEDPLIKAKLAKFLGLVVDAAHANRAALKKLHQKYPWMVNLVCLAHGLNNLLKDYRKHMAWLDDAIKQGLRIIHCVQETPRLKAELRRIHQQQKTTYKALQSNCETRFATNCISLQSLVDNNSALTILAANTALWKKHGDIRQCILRKGFWKKVQWALELMQPVAQTITAVEANKPQLSKVLPIWKGLRAKLEAFCNKDPSKVNKSKLLEVFNKRYDKNYHPALSAAFVVDLANAHIVGEREVEYGTGIQEKVARPAFKGLTSTEKDDATKYVSIMAGRLGLSSVQARADWVAYQGVGNPGENDVTSCDISAVKLSGKAGASIGFWNAQSEDKDGMRVLANLAIRLLSMHTTSCQPEREQSVLSRIYRAERSRLAIEKAEKMLFISSCARLERNMRKSDHELELEVLEQDEEVEEDVEEIIDACVETRNNDDQNAEGSDMEDDDLDDDAWD